jgi:serine/threonine-protein kinase
MGAVFRAQDTRLLRTVALKVLSPGLSRDATMTERFRREAQLAAQLDHPHLARVFDVGEDLGLQFIAMEYIPGLNLRELIQREGPLPVVTVVNCACQISRALLHLAARGIVHRDLKPSNIIWTPEGVAKLVDMGLARWQTHDDAQGELTSAGTTLGTFDYIAPEQARDPRQVDARSDIYSLGCTLYHMLTGEPPYPEGTVLQKLLSHQGEEAPDPSQKNPQVPPLLATVVRRMMAKDPRNRQQTPAVLMRELTEVAQSLGLQPAGPEGTLWAAPPPGPSWWRRNAAPLSTAALLLMILGWLEFGRGTPGTSTAVRPLEPAVVELGRTESTDTAASGGMAASREETIGESVSPEPASLVAGLKTGARELAGILALAGEGIDTSPGTGSPADPLDNQRIEPQEVAGQGLAPRDDEEDSSLRGAPDRGNRVKPPAEGTPAAVEMPLEDEGFVLIGREGSGERRFATLEGALSAVRSDGAVIELRFNGRRRESGLKISRRVMIRADRRYSPVVELAPQPVPDADSVRGVTVGSGGLELVGCSFILLVGESTRAESWSLFALDRPDLLRLQDCVLTIVNPQGRPAAAIEWTDPDGSMMPDMPIPGTNPGVPLNLELSESLLRGEGDLFLIRRPEPLRMAIRQSVIALRGALVHERLTTNAPPEQPPQELRLDHVTVVLGDSLARVDCASEVRRPPQLQVSATNCIFSSIGDAPLVSMSANLPLQDFRGQFLWAGRYNFYDRFATFWNVVSREGVGRTESWDFFAWRRHWTESAESNARIDAVEFVDRDWQQLPFHQVRKDRFVLDRRSASNQAPGGAGDSSDAGANLLLIPPLVENDESESALRERTRS